MWPFPPKRFKGNALLRAGSLGLDTDGRVVALGDFNGDQFLDVISVGSDQQTLTIHLWDHERFTYRTSSVFRHSQPVVNVVPGDFTQSGRLDLLVMSQPSPSRDQLDLFLYRAVATGGLETTPLSLPPSSASQPIPFDSTGNLRIDLLGISPSFDDQASFSTWKNVWNASQQNSAVYELTRTTLDGLQCKPSNPHSHAVVDLDGDCLADIVLICDDGNTGNKVFQIWVNQKDSGFRLQQSGRLPAGTQSISFADVDRDGTIDMVFATCSSVSRSTGLGNDCYVNVAYNKQLPLCASTTSLSFKNGQRVCRAPEGLCIADPNFTFDLSDRPGNDAFVRVSIKDLVPTSDGSTPQLLVLDTTYGPPLPVPLKIGDLNLDGFVDIVPIVATPSPGDRSKLARTPKILGSVPCRKHVAGCGLDGKGRRGWSVIGRDNNVLEEFQDARGVVLVDIDEDGTLDILVQRTGEQGQGNVLFVQNNFYYDAFFLKAIVLNGGCPGGWCSTANGSRFHPFGVSYSGATYKYTVIDTTGQRAAAAVAQLPQTAYQSLLTPYSFIGLGRTNNYIENFFVGSTKHQEEHFINMEGVIPNSKVVIVPPPDDSQRTEWRKELYLRPGEWIPLVTLTVVIATVLLALIVLVLHLNEKREDELERRKVSHHINFDAL